MAPLRALPLLLASSVLLVGFVALAPTAEASLFVCRDLGLGGPGALGRTLEFASDAEHYACSAGFDYAIDMCMFLLNPSICLAIA